MAAESNRPYGLVAIVSPAKTSKSIPSSLTLPLYESRVPAGFPSPAEDYVERAINLNDELIKHPASTFMVRVSGDSMTGAGIFHGDVLLVDRALEPTDGKIVIAALDGMLTIKRLRIKGNSAFLMPENPNYKPIAVKELSDLTIWGVVTSVIRQF
jgi:DNA polymerase V